MNSPEHGQGGEYVVRLELFEGPLDLLLHIIRKHELDILDIPVAFVLERYLAFLETMSEMELEIASEYLAMAATLVYIKSKMLLPGEQIEEEEEQEIEDPRAELVRRLLEYKKYRQAAAVLASEAALGHKVFSGGYEPDPMERDIERVGLFDLVECVADLVREAQAKGRDASDLLADRITVTERITEIAEIVARKRNVTFRDLLARDFLVFDVVITFLALLEMARLKMIRLVQGDDSDALMIMEPPRYGQEDTEVDDG